MPCQNEWDNINSRNKWAFRFGNLSMGLAASTSAVPNPYTFIGGCVSGFAAYRFESMRNTAINDYKKCMNQYAETIQQEIRRAQSTPVQQQEIDRLNAEFKLEPLK